MCLHNQVVNLKPNANRQIYLFIIHYRCPKKGYLAKMDTDMTPKANPHIMHLPLQSIFLCMFS